MAHLHYHNKKQLQKLYDKALKDGDEVIIYQGEELLINYLKYVLEFFDMKDTMTGTKKQ